MDCGWGHRGLALAALLPGLQQLRTLVLTKCLLPEAATSAILGALRASPNDEAVATAQRDSLVADLEVRKPFLFQSQRLRAQCDMATDLFSFGGGAAVVRCVRI